MSHKNKAGYNSNCQIVAERTPIATESSTVKVPVQKRKEDTKDILYINRI
jgi:hypothetical protein